MKKTRVEVLEDRLLDVLAALRKINHLKHSDQQMELIRNKHEITNELAAHYNR